MTSTPQTTNAPAGHPDGSVDHSPDGGSESIDADGAALTLDIGDVLSDAEPEGGYGELEPASPPLVGEDGRVRLSFSRIDAYQDCSLRFRYDYVDKLPSRPRTYLSFGTSVHAALEAFHDRTLFGMPSEDDLLGFLYDGWDPTGFADQPREIQLREYRRAQDVLRRYHRRVADSYRPAAETEKFFEVPLGELSTIVGFIDRIDIDDDGRYHVVDYKTGRLKDRQRVRKSLQLSIYALACEHLYGVLPATVSLDFVVAGAEVRVPVDELDLERARRIADQTARGVLASHYEPSPSRLCDWCDHREICPAWEPADAEGFGPTVIGLLQARRDARRAVERVRSLEGALEHARQLLDERGVDPVVTVAPESEVARPAEPAQDP